MNEQKFVKISESFFCDCDYINAFKERGLTSIDAVFSFSDGVMLTKKELAKHRERIQFTLNSPETVMFLKRYNKAPLSVQVKNWICHGTRISLASCDYEPGKELAAANINVPKVVAYGQECGMLFEKRSFVISEKLPNAQSLEKKLPAFFEAPQTSEKAKLKRDFLERLAAFIRKFHETGYRHRDLYLAHIFYGDNGEFYLIDLARAFKPNLFSERFRVKDLAQLHYSAPKFYFTKCDRLRFFCWYAGIKKLSEKDKVLVKKIMNKALKMAQHSRKHGKAVPFRGEE